MCNHLGDLVIDFLVAMNRIPSNVMPIINILYVYMFFSNTYYGFIPYITYIRLLKISITQLYN
jgi:hypothetical protein